MDLVNPTSSQRKDKVIPFLGSSVRAKDLLVQTATYARHTVGSTMGDGSNVLVRYAQLDEQAHLVFHIGEVVERAQLAGEAYRHSIHLTFHLTPVISLILVPVAIRSHKVM